MSYGSPVMNVRIACVIAAGAALLAWPALVNGYPLVFSDTGSFLEQLLRPFMIWDKPWVYGPVITMLSLTLTLWLPAIAQCLLVSWILWCVQRVLRPPSPAWHLGVCLVLAIGSAAPWFASMLMPDIFAPLTVLAMFLLACEQTARRRWVAATLATFAIASHLANLPIAAADCLVILCLCPSAAVRTGLPLLAALALLMATNVVGHGQLGVSPYGSVFMLARLAADGPATRYLAQNCPAAGYQMCAWVGRMPSDADDFLWNPTGPVWTFPGGPIALAPEASRIVTATLLHAPLAVAGAAIRNTRRQLADFRFDRVVSSNGLDQTVGTQLDRHYPTTDQRWFATSAQRSGQLVRLAEPLQAPQAVLLMIGAVASLGIALRVRFRERPWLVFVSLIFIGLLSNAFATGALAGPHGRYQARIAWLLLLPPMFRLAQQAATPAETSFRRAAI